MPGSMPPDQAKPTMGRHCNHLPVTPWLTRLQPAPPLPTRLIMPDSSSPHPAKQTTTPMPSTGPQMPESSGSNEVDCLNNQPAGSQSSPALSPLMGRCLSSRNARTVTPGRHCNHLPVTSLAHKIAHSFMVPKQQRQQPANQPTLGEHCLATGNNTGIRGLLPSINEVVALDTVA